MTNPFDYVNSISYTKENIKDIDDYNVFLTNKALSYYNDTIFYAAEINRYWKYLTKRMQYDFYRIIIRKRKRFSKWYKEIKYNDIECIKKYYRYNTKRAQEVLDILTKEQINNIRNKTMKDGKFE